LEVTDKLRSTVVRIGTQVQQPLQGMKKTVTSQWEGREGKGREGRREQRSRVWLSRSKL
jgi:hypothetical protein